MAVFVFNNCANPFVISGLCNSTVKQFFKSSKIKDHIKHIQQLLPFFQYNYNYYLDFLAFCLLVSFFLVIMFNILIMSVGQL